VETVRVDRVFQISKKMSSLLTLRSKALLVELALAISVSSAVIAFSGGITRQSYTNALVVAALVLVPFEVLRQSGVLERLFALLQDYRVVTERQLEVLKRLDESAILNRQAQEEASLAQRSVAPPPLADAMRIANQQGAIHLRMGRFDEAIQTLEHARRLGERLLTEGLPTPSIALTELLGVYLRLAQTYELLQRYEKAEQLLYEAQVLNERRLRLAEAPRAAAATSEPEYVGELERLALLRERGILSEEEFEAKKKQILGI
jgi:tetratricopeptide (TPR) repeat protein